MGAIHTPSCPARQPLETEPWLPTPGKACRARPAMLPPAVALRVQGGGSQRPGVTSTPPATNLGGCRMAELPLAATSTQALVGSTVAPGDSTGQGEGNQDHHQPHQGGQMGPHTCNPSGPGQGEHSGSPSPSWAGRWPCPVAHSSWASAWPDPAFPPASGRFPCQKGSRPEPQAQPCHQARVAWGAGGGAGGQGVYLSSLLNWGWASAISRLLLNIALLQREQSEKTELLPQRRQTAWRPGHTAPSCAQGTQSPGDTSG